MFYLNLFMKDTFVLPTLPYLYICNSLISLIVNRVLSLFHCVRDFANSKYNLNDRNMNPLADTSYTLKQEQVT